MLAIVCPGQGSQTSGMLTAWLELDGAGELIDRLSAAAGLDLCALGTTADAEAVRDTAVAQPLIVATSLLSARLLLDGTDPADAAGVTAGHSVGELAAAALAGVLTDEQAVRLVAARGAAMAAAAALRPTGMSAVVGGDSTDVTAAIENAGLTAANVNGAGQVVAAGALEGLARLAAQPPARARVIPLQVAGAFHTVFMQPAYERFASIIAAEPAQDPRTRLLSDADGRSYADLPGARAPYGSGEDVLGRLARQVVAPVRWDLCQESFVTLGVTALLELAPGGVLTGLARRTLPGVEAVALRTPSDLDAARDLVARHMMPNNPEDQP